MSTDAELLRRYVEERSEAAFAELVRLHLNLVYFAALRQVGGDVHRAKDVAQSVFTDLARKAHTLTARATLTGWLHTSTRFAASKARRADFSRQQYEQEAATMNALVSPSDSDPPADWQRLRPMIDDVIHELDERDREAVLLRYFENRPFAEVGATLRLSEDAARMRVDRALDKLRVCLERRGVKSTSAALAAAFANEIAASAPAGLASTIAGAALASTAGSVAIGAAVFMSLKSTLIVGVVALAAVLATFFQWQRAAIAENELESATADRAGLRVQLRTEQQRAERFARDFAALQTEIDGLKAKPVATLSAPKSVTTPAATAAEQLRRSSINKAVLNNLRAIAAARDHFQIENGRPPASIDELVGDHKFIKTLVAVDGESYANLAMNAGQPLTVVASDGTPIQYIQAPMTPEEEHVAELRRKIGPSIQRVMDAYKAAGKPLPPPNPEALLPYFATPQEGADFLEFVEAQKAANKPK